MSRCLVALALLALAAGAQAAPTVPDGARGETAPEGGKPRLEGRLLVDHRSARAGETFQVGLLLEMAPHWHVYWRNSGQSGAPPRLVWRGEGLEVQAIAWPFPQVFREAEGFITTYGYTGEVLLASPASFKAGTSGEVKLELEADVLVCEIQCIPGELHLARTIRVGDASEPAASDERAVFTEFAARVPRAVAEHSVELEAVYSLSAIRPSDSFRAALAVHACAPRGDAMDCAELEPGTGQIRDSFVPDQVDGIELLVDGGRRPSFLHGGFLVTMDGTAGADPPNGNARLRGALALRRDGATEYVEVDAPLPRAAAGAPVLALENPWLEPDPNEAAVAGVPFWRAVLLALLGGLVLNLMPCVLPVLAIKVFGLAELAQHGRGEVTRHGIAYTAGVLASMLALALVVAGLRAAGTSVGWGFQFQEPLFVAAIAAVLVVFALSLFGVFEFSFDVTRLARGELARGRRAAQLLRRPARGGAGDAVLGAVPRHRGRLRVREPDADDRRDLPRGRGRPRAAVRADLRGARLGAARAAQRPVDGCSCAPCSASRCWAAPCGCSGSWAARRERTRRRRCSPTCSRSRRALVVFGALQKSERTGAARIALAVVAVLALAGLRVLPLAGAEPPAAARGEGGASDELGQRFSAAGVAAARARGAPVFVYFTAEWCLTCKVNEHVVLDDARVREQLAAAGFATLRGRLDPPRRRDPQRAGALRKGRRTLYLVYGPGAPDRPIVLPELLTVDLFLNALHQAAPITKEDRT